MTSCKITQQMAQILIRLVVFLVLLAGCSSNDDTIIGAVSSTHQASRKSESTTISGTEIWRVRTDPPNYGSNHPFPFVLDDMVVANSFPDQKNRDKSLLTAYSFSTGQVIWQTSYKDNYGASIWSACVDKVGKRLFLIYGRGVSAFDLVTGEQSWRITESVGTRGKTFVNCQDNGTLHVRTDGIYFYAIDPNSGKILSIQKQDMPDTIAFSREGVNVIQLQKAKRTLAQDETGQILWQVESYIIGGPVLFIEENDILISSGLPLTSWLTRMNYRTGQTIWIATRGFVSNPVLFDGKVFALTIDGKLVALDVSSGQEIGNVQFDRNFSDALGETSFFVAAQPPYVVVYFGDTQELVAFKFETK